MASRFFAKVTGLLLLALSPAFAQSAKFSQSIAPREPLKDKWLAALKETDQKLRSHQWEAAAKRARQAGEEIVDLAGTGESPAYSLAVVDVFRAIAAAELGSQDDAEWYWDSAISLFPDVAKTDLTPYGTKAMALRQRTLRIIDKETMGRGRGDEKSMVVDGKTVERPRIVRQPLPDYPKALQLLGAEGWVIVSAVIGQDGRPQQPVILEAKGGGAGMRYVALDTLGRWRFEPAKSDGVPVPVQYVLSMNFKQGRR